jgi:hypothetical protein
MASHHEAHENSILDLVNKILSEYSSELNARGITRESVKLERSGENGEPYNSEIQITFWKDNEFVDIIEFFLFRNGVPDASSAEIGAWLHGQIRDILAGQS